MVSVDENGSPPGAPKVVDATLVRKLFGNTIAPFEPVIVEPLVEGGFFWEEALSDRGGAEVLEPIAGRWRELIRFFHESEELVQPSFAAIGFGGYRAPEGASVVDASTPPGFEMNGSCLPRMPFAFTHAGSLVGLFGYVVWT